MCTMKFSSNVIEKCLDKNSSKDIKEVVLHSLLSEEDDLIGDLLVDCYGNYVIQRALEVSKGPVYICFLDKISKSLPKLSTVPFGIKLSQKLLSLYPDLKSFSLGKDIHISNNIQTKGTQESNKIISNPSNPSKKTNFKNSKTPTSSQVYNSINNINMNQIPYQGNFMPYYPNVYYPNPYFPVPFNQVNQIWNNNYYSQVDVSLNSMNQMNQLQQYHQQSNQYPIQNMKKRKNK